MNYDDHQYWNSARPRLNSWGDELHRDSLIVLMSVGGVNDSMAFPIFNIVEWFNEPQKLAGFMRHCLLNTLCDMLLGGNPDDDEEADVAAILSMMYTSACGELPEQCPLERCTMEDYFALTLANMYCGRALILPQRDKQWEAVRSAALWMSRVTEARVRCEVFSGADELSAFRESARLSEYDVLSDGEFPRMLDNLLCDMGAPELAHENTDEDEETTVDFYI